MQISIEVTGIDTVSAYLAGMERRAKNLVPAWQLIEQILISETADNFKTETTPEGSPWQALSPQYKASKRKRESVGANRILVLDDIMRNSTDANLFPSRMEFGVTDDKAPWHQFGAGNVPARPFLGVNAEINTAIIDIIADYLTDETF